MVIWRKRKEAELKEQRATDEHKFKVTHSQEVLIVVVLVHYSLTSVLT